MRTALLSCSCVALALGLASCGGDAGSSGDADPASLVPANAAMYFEATIRPEGEQREDVLAAAGKIMRTPDPAAKIQELVDEGFKDDGPQLGARLRAVGRREGGRVAEATSPARTRRSGGVIAVRDEDAAEAALPKLQDDGKRGTYEGVNYVDGRRGHGRGARRRLHGRGRPAGLQGRSSTRATATTWPTSDRYTDVDRRARGRSARALLRRHEGAHRRRGEGGSRDRGRSSSRSARSCRSTSSGRAPAR